MAYACCKLQWAQLVLLELNIYVVSAELKRDNQATSYIAKNSIFHEHTKHIEVDCHFIHDMMQKK